jgi:hypothetical protein
MKNFKARFLALCGLMVLVAASVAPLVASAQTPTCPTLTIECGGKLRHCAGTVNGDKCDYDRSCINCGGGGSEVAIEESAQ